LPVYGSARSGDRTVYSDASFRLGIGQFMLIAIGQYHRQAAGKGGISRRSLAQFDFNATAICQD
jgi:hypothetical protein